MTKRLHHKDDGLDYINKLRASLAVDRYNPKAKKVIKRISGDIYFVVNDRKDRRHGIVNMPAPKDPYCEDLFKSMFSRWDNDEK